MKKLLLTLTCLGVVSVSAFAGCPGGGCGGGSKDTGTEKPKTGGTTTQTLAL